MGGAGNLIAVPVVNRPRTKYWIRYQLFPGGRTSYITLYSNSTKTGAGQLEEFSPRQLTVCEIRLDLVTWSVENHPGFWVETRVTHFPCHTAAKLLQAARVS